MMWLYMGFILSAIGETYFYMMQRAALIESRETPESFRVPWKNRVPYWYGLSWLFILGKWGFAIALAIFVSWLHAVIAILAVFLLNIIVPIPQKYFTNIFEKHQLRSIIDEVKKKY